MHADAGCIIETVCKQGADELFKFNDEEIPIEKYISSKEKNSLSVQPSLKPCCDMSCNMQEFDPQIKLRVVSVMKNQSKCEINRICSTTSTVRNKWAFPLMASCLEDNFSVLSSFVNFLTFPSI